MKIQIINGPNLNLLGEREKEIYGNIGMKEYLKIIREHFKDFHIDYFQSNIEGELIDKIQEAAKISDGIVLNSGGYTHTSVAIRDAVASVACPVVEVHVSNIYNRESFRHTSLIAPKCKGSVIGFGLDGYRLAIESLRFIYSKKS
ncbi:MAG: type II 3-dehydroquinate dehydratase [Bacteroidota bacterium]